MILRFIALTSLLLCQSCLAQDEVIGNKGDHYLILSSNKSDGSTSVNWAVKSDGTYHTIKTLSTGERCNGGAKKLNNWQYAINLNPVNILSQGSGAPLQMDAYRDLDQGENSCIAQAFYQFDPNTQMAKLLHVNLGKKELPIEAWVLELNYQYCFNRLYNSYLYRGQLTLNQTDLDRFKNQFESICMASGR